METQQNSLDLTLREIFNRRIVDHDGSDKEADDRLNCARTQLRQSAGPVRWPANRPGHPVAGDTLFYILGC